MAFAPHQAAALIDPLEQGRARRCAGDHADAQALRLDETAHDHRVVAYEPEGPLDRGPVLEAEFKYRQAGVHALYPSKFQAAPYEHHRRPGGKKCPIRERGCTQSGLGSRYGAGKCPAREDPDEGLDRPPRLHPPRNNRLAGLHPELAVAVAQAERSVDRLPDSSNLRSAAAVFACDPTAKSSPRWTFRIC